MMPRICDFPGSVRIGKPRDWENDLDGDCLDIFVAPQIDTLTGMTMMHTIYQFSDEELEALKEGGILRLSIAGKAHPVFQMAVLDKSLAEAISPVPKGDLGPVVRRVE